MEVEVISWWSVKVVMGRLCDSDGSGGRNDNTGGNDDDCHTPKKKHEKLRPNLA